VHGLSFVKNPEPVTVTAVPIGPEDGLRAKDGDRTVNVFEEKSPTRVPVPVTVYVPGEVSATVNEPVNLPPEIAQVGAFTGAPDNVHAVSLWENPVPDTRTVDPT
jgi:hypothetical protein